MSFLSELPGIVSRLTEQAAGAAVRIGRSPGRGGGVVIAEGLVLTNAHNLRDATTTVTFADGRSVQGAVRGVDPAADLTVLTVDTGGVNPVAWGPAGAPIPPGTAVFTVAALPDGGARVTFGTISSVGRRFRGPRGRLITDGIEHTAVVGRGSSGSALVDVEGRLVGLNTHRVGGGLYLAIPAGPQLRDQVDSLGRGESPERVHVGIAIVPPFAARRLRAAVGLPEMAGLLIRGVEHASPAERAGLRRGDLLVEAAGRALQSPDDLFAVIDQLDPSANLSLRVMRGTDELTVTVSFAPPEAGSPA